MKPSNHRPNCRYVSHSVAASMLAGIAALLLPGCESFRLQKLSHESPGPQASAEHRVSNGWLVAYTAKSWESMNDEPPSYVHSDYKLLTLEGRMFMHVRNVGPIGEPEKVCLDPGSYTIVAQARGKGTVRRALDVESGQTTVLHFDQ